MYGGGIRPKPSTRCHGVVTIAHGLNWTMAGVTNSLYQRRGSAGAGRADEKLPIAHLFMRNGPSPAAGEGTASVGPIFERYYWTDERGCFDPSGRLWALRDCL